MNKWLVLILPLLMLTTALAEETVKVEELVVTASRIEEPLEETTSDVIVITREEIEKTNVAFVADVLRRVPEINLVQKGGAGKVATVSLRGGSSSQTLVMIDGVKVKSTTLGMFDFSGLMVDDIERIEIVKGPQSTMYGSEAMAGVINIITKKGEGKPRLTASFEGGSFNTYSPSLAVSGGTDKVDYRVTASYFRTDGISAVKNGDERDGYLNAAVSGKVGIKLGESAEVELTGRHYYDRNELDASGADDLNYVERGHHSMYSAKGKLYLLNDAWEQVLTLSAVRDLLIGTDPDTQYNNYDIITGMDAIDWQHNLYFTDAYTLTAGAEYRKEAGENKGVFDESIENKALYLNNKLKVFGDVLVLSAGLRYDDHETAGSATTYRVGTLLNFKEAGLRLRGSYGTGFRSPTFIDLFWPGAGNPDLKPETSRSWEAGVEKMFLEDRVTVSVTYFDQKYNDLISGWPPVNINKARIKGVETKASVQVTETFGIRAGHTYLDTEAKATGNRLPRRPDDKFTLAAEYSNDRFSVLADLLYVGGRYEDTANQEHLASYGVVNLSGTYKATKTLSLFARVENLFDEDYEEAADYGTPGLSFYGGMKLVF